MRIGLFADPHYADMEDVGVAPHVRHCRDALNRVSAAMEQFRQAQVDVVVCLGDLTNGGSHDEATDLTAISRVVRSYGLPCFLAPGNHDAQLFSPETFEAITGFSFEPAPFTVGDATLLILNTNYTRAGQPYVAHDVDWTDCAIPPKQLAYIRRVLQDAPGEVVVCSHAVLSPCPWQECTVSNAAEVRDILEQSGKVRRVYSGHFHDGFTDAVNGITYDTLPALCEDWGNAVRIVEV